MKKILLTFVTCMLLAVAGWAQQAQGKLDIQFNRNVLQPGDSLLVSVDYKDAGSSIPAQPLATLELIVENEQGQRTRLRWPVINGHASGTLYLPDSLPRGKYQLLAAFQQRFFEVIGKITDPKNNSSIQAMILTKNGNWDQQEVPVGSDGSFAIRNWLFEDNALLAFSSTKNNHQPLDIRIQYTTRFKQCTPCSSRPVFLHWQPACCSAANPQPAG